MGEEQSGMEKLRTHVGMGVYRRSFRLYWGQRAEVW